MSVGTARDALRYATRKLDHAGIVAPARDARLLLAGAMAIGPDRLTLVEGDLLEAGVQERFQRMVTERLAARPVAQILGTRLFWGRPFRVTRHVLDPRPETETLIASALEGPMPANLLDLGTGSGSILLTLLAEWPGARGLGTDTSPDALEVAQGNAMALGFGDRAVLLRSDWLEGIEGRFDLVVSNPPYIPSGDIAALAPDVRDWEPHAALTPGPTGLESYERIADGLAAHLAPGGRALFEIGAEQGETVPALFRTAGFARVDLLRDLDARPRVVRVIGDD